MPSILMAALRFSSANNILAILPPDLHLNDLLRHLLELMLQLHGLQLLPSRAHADDELIWETWLRYHANFRARRHLTLKALLLLVARNRHSLPFLSR